FDGFFELGLGTWDVAAGAALVLELGGRVSDWSGGEGWLESGDILAAPAAVHEVLLKLASKAQQRELDHTAPLLAQRDARRHPRRPFAPGGGPLLDPGGPKPLQRCSFVLGEDLAQVVPAEVAVAGTEGRAQTFTVGVVEVGEAPPASC